MKKLICIILALTGSVFAENLLPDASFELGGKDYAMREFAELPDSRGQEYIAPALDTKNPVHGKISLRFDNPYAQPRGLRSPDFNLKDGETYTFSFYAKSSKPVKLRAMIFSVSSNDKKKRNGVWDNGNVKHVSLTPEWKRCAITFTPKKGFRTYLADLLWGEGSDATVWLDALMISHGKEAVEFVPKNQVEFILNASVHCRIEGEKPIQYTLSGINYGTQNADAEISLQEYDDYHNKLLRKEKIKLEIPAGEIINRSFFTTQNRYGVYSVRGEYEINGKKVRIWPYLYGVSGKYELKNVNPEKDFLLGCEESFGFAYPDLNGGKPWYHRKETDLQEYERISRNRGVRLLRMGNGLERCFEWKKVETAPGKFDFTRADFLVDRAIRQNYFILGVIGNNLLEQHLPDWIVKNGEISKTLRIYQHKAVLPNPEMWRNYVRATVGHFKGKIKYWEILNEANLTTAPEDYAELLKIAFEECRKIDPAIRIAAPNVTGDHNGQMGEFLDKFGKKGGFRYTDIVSFHPYSSREEDSPTPSRTAIADIRNIIEKYRKGLPLWNTELYYLYNNPPHPVDAIKGRAYHFTRRLLVDLSEGIRQTTLMPDDYYYRVDRNPDFGYAPDRVIRRRIPSELYIAGNAFARLMEGATPVAKLKTPRGVTLSVYRQHNGGPIAAIWNFSKKQDFDFTPSDRESMDFFDLFGNPVAYGKTFRITRDPIYIKGKKDMDSLINALKSGKITAQKTFELTRVRYFIKDGKPAVAVELRSAATKPQNLKLRLLSVPDAKAIARETSNLTLNPEKTTVILLPIEAKNPVRLKNGKVKLMIYDGRTTETFELPIESLSLAEDGKKITLDSSDRLTFGKAEKYAKEDSSLSFSVTKNADYFKMEFQVRDTLRGIFSPGAPWNGDCIELFFDRSPLVNLERREYTKDVFRLFLCPSAEGKPAYMKHAGDIDANSILWNITETKEGYAASVAIPWKTLRLSPGETVSFDVALNDNDGKMRKTQLTWSGNSENHLYRHCFGIWNSNSKESKKTLPVEKSDGQGSSSYSQNNQPN